MVKRKIFDITPHQQTDLRKSASRKKPAASGELTDLGRKKIILLFVGLCLFAGLALSYFLIPPKADIEIWPKKENKNERVAVTVAASPKNGNYIPGKIVESEKIVSGNFSAQGTILKVTKAQGTIRIYNNYSTAVQPLLANTRFVSDDGKLFRTASRVVIPGASYSGSKLVPGFIDAKVAADQAGEEYNIDPSTFSIPGFAGTPKYTAFYAKSAEPMSGGLKAEVFQITDEDLESAKKSLIEKAVLESKTAVNDAVSGEPYIIINEAISSKAVDFTSSAKAGDEVKDFSAQIKSSVNALVFKEADLRFFAGNYIKSKIAPGENFIDSSLKIEYVLKGVHLDKGEINLELTISGQTHSLQEANAIKELVQNKSVEEVEEIIKGFPQIEKSRIKFWPFWVRFAPEDLDRIKITLLLD
ncbi:MAG: hypothetical protein HYW69_00255 [Candidatus Nealsonbacteria bacterium]|nr:hypothetical protein [Candidatus Nealsonbacteria bacterium]